MALPKLLLRQAVFVADRIVGRAIDAVRDTVADVIGQVETIKAPPVWIKVTDFRNGWVNYETTEASFYQAAYYKDIFGWVHLRGLIKNGTIGQAAFFLPAGYRPTRQVSFVPVNSGGSTAVTDNAELAVGPTGSVVPNANIGNTYLYLNSVRFFADQ